MSLFIIEGTQITSAHGKWCDDETAVDQWKIKLKQRILQSPKITQKLIINGFTSHSIVCDLHRISIDSLIETLLSSWKFQLTSHRWLLHESFMFCWWKGLLSCPSACIYYLLIHSFVYSIKNYCCPLFSHYCKDNRTRFFLSLAIMTHSI